MELPAELMRLREFHGHLGPFATLGCRAGEHALRELGARRHFGLHIVVRCPPQPPPSCLVDGLQFSTGCTMGKRNIELVPSDDISIEFRNQDTGQELVLRLPAETAAALPRWIQELGEDAASRRVWEAGVALFEQEVGPGR
jgi:formylmethanofuran dehydrogenase subunit E